MSPSSRGPSSTWRPCDELEVFYVFEIDGDHLVLQRRKYGREPYAPVGEDRFRGDSAVRFTRDDTGAVGGFLISTSRLLDLRFRRVAAR